mmetsp:Transcript_5144/g.12089  ORF Transcript_5144/g.12089 Transcript_5144/m.12089 type:complete len:408 (-) Transcript_5144:327-1550(-)
MFAVRVARRQVQSAAAHRFGTKAFSAQQVQLAGCTMSGSAVGLEFDDGTKLEVPTVYLRDSCRCPECFHPSTLQRRVSVLNQPGITDIEEARVQQGALSVLWKGGHHTKLDAQWLLRNTRRQDQPVTAWTAPWMYDNLDRITFGFQDVIDDPSVCEAWLQAFKTYGFGRLRGANLQLGELNRLSESVGIPMRTTIYGEGGQMTFQVSSKPDPNNQAYTADALGLHTDLPFYAAPPGAQLLHFIRKDESGGASTFCDGMAAADELRAIDPEGWKLLTTVPVVFEDIDPSENPKYHLEAAHPVLELDPTTEKCRAVHFNNGVRSAVWGTTDPEVISAHYRATELLDKLMNSDQFMFKMDALPGDVWVFNNRRVLHGREAMSVTSPRMLEGCYFEWDDIHSKLRLLSKRH